MGLFSRSIQKNSFPWTELTSEEQLKEALSIPDKAIFLFKHSTRCNISEMVKNRFERDWINPESAVELYYLDLLNHRNISDKIEELTGIQHQSPQLIIWKDGKVIYHTSHNAIQVRESIAALTL